MTFDIQVLGFGDNVVDKYEHISVMYPGGNTVNFAVYAQMYGAERSAYMGYFGDDAEAEHVIAALEEEQIETVKCKQLHGPNGCSVNTIIDGDRVFLHSNEGGIRGETPFVLDRFDLEYIRGFDLVHSGNYCFTETELGKIRAAGVPVSFDFSDDSDDSYYEKVAPNVDFAFCSFDGSEEDCREHLKKVKDLGPELVCASRGAKGCMMYDGTDYYIQPAAPLEQVVDTMGAGDSLLTVFLVNYLYDRKHGSEKASAIRDSLPKAAAFAAKICGIDGAFGHGKKYGDE